MSSRSLRGRVPVDLSAAAARLRENPPAGFPGKNGRPRTRPIEASVTGTLRAQAPAKTRMNSGHGARAQALQTPVPPALTPRLLGLAAAAEYLGMAPWTVRELEWRGVIARVRVPLPGGRALRKILFDRDELDRLIAQWKEATREVDV